MSEFDKKISALTSGSDSQAADEYVIARGGSNYKITGANIAAAATKLGTIATGVWQGTAIADTYLATISTAGKVSNSATTATSANTASAIVARDASGNFTAGTITATLSGAAPAGSLSGTTLASNVVSSSLTSVGTLSSLTVSGDLTVDTNTLKVVASTNQVGIGTASPASRLTIKSPGASGEQTIFNVENASTTGSIAKLTYNQDTDALRLINESAFSGATLQLGVNATDLTIDQSGNLGLGVTPSAWGADSKGAFQNPAGAVFQYNNDRVFIGQNTYIDSANADRFVGNGYGTRYRQYQGTHSWWMSTVSNSSGAGASQSLTQAMTLDASGNLGVGTTPSRRLHVYDTSNIPVRIETNTSDTKIEILTTSGAQFIQASGNNLLFGTNSTERASITSGGDFEIGSVAGTGTRTLTVQTNTSGDPTLTLSAAGADSGSFWFDRANLRLYARASNTGGVYLASGGTSWTAVSDERQKDIIEDIADATAKVSALRSVIGRYKTDSEDVRRSFLIAQDVAEAFPEAADTSDEDALGVRYSDVIPLLVAAVKELTARLEALEA